MSRSALEVFTTRLQLARGQAEYLPRPEEWRARVDEIAELTRSEPPAAAELVTLLVRYVDAEMRSHKARVARVNETGRGSEPKDLNPELARLVQAALVLIGSRASEALISGYYELAAGAAAKRALAVTLETIGDSAAVRFFEALKDHDPEARRALAAIERKRER